MKKHRPINKPVLASLLGALSACLVNGGEVFSLNFDDSFPSGTYSFGYAGYGPVEGGNVTVDESIVQSSAVNFGVGIDGGSALQFFGDTTALETAIVEPNNYSYAGFGIGINVDLFGVQLTSPELSNYVVDLSVVANGLQDGVSQSNGLVDVRFFAPDGTLLPDDEDLDGDIIFTGRYRNVALAKEAFENSSFRLDSSFEVRQGSVENFTNHHGAIDFMQVVVEYPGAIGDFGIDADNEVIIDNLSFTEGAPPPPPAENPVAVVDFDADPRSWGGSYYAFASAADTPDPLLPAVGDLPRTAEVIAKGDSLAQVACIDATAWAGAAAGTYPGVAWMGFGSTATKETEAGFLPSGEASEYKVQFDVMSEGFLADPSGKFLVVLLAPDDTLSPPDADTNRDVIIRFRIADDNGFGNGFPLTDTFVTYTYNLEDVQVDGGSLENLQNFYDQVTVAEFVLEGVTTSDNTGFDADNCVVMDNVSLLHLTPPGPEFATPNVLSVDTMAPDQLSISFVSLPGHVYSIQSSLDIESGFTEVGQVEASDVSTVYQRTAPLGMREYFKVEDLGVPTP